MRMKLAVKSDHYQPIRVSMESVAFGAVNIEMLAKQLVDWTKMGLGVIAMGRNHRLQVITNSVVIRGKVLGPDRKILWGPKIERLFVGPFSGRGRSSIELLRQARNGHDLAQTHLNRHR